MSKRTLSSVKETVEQEAAEPEETPEEIEPPKRRGRPPGSGNRKRAPDPQVIDPTVVDTQLDMALRQIVQLPILVWKLEPPLQPQEEDMLVGAAKPVLYKWAGTWLEAVGPEFMLGIALWFVYGQRFLLKKQHERAQQYSQQNAHSGNPGVGEVPPSPAFVG